MQGLKSVIFTICQRGWDDRALLVWPSRIQESLARFKKDLFALGSYEFLAMLKGKTR